MKPLLPGTRYEWSVSPTAGDTASAIGNDGVDVVSTPATIGFLEMTCHNMLSDAFDPGEASVGIAVDIRHRAAAFPGTDLNCTAELLTVDGVRYAFAVEARQAGRLIMDGRHERAIVHLEDFLQTKPGDRPAGGEPSAGGEQEAIRFWFDIQSPWSYLAATRIDAIARRARRKVDWMPFSLPRVVAAINGRRPLEESPAFVDWYNRDLQDWADMEGLEIAFHPEYPLRNSRALRVCLMAKDHGCVQDFALKLFNAYWGEACDITDPALLGRLAEECGLDPEAAQAVAVCPEHKSRLERNNTLAIERGVFGAPTMECDGRLFFGNDRLAMLERHLSRRTRTAATDV